MVCKLACWAHNPLGLGFRVYGFKDQASSLKRGLAYQVPPTRWPLVHHICEDKLTYSHYSLTFSRALYKIGSTKKRNNN